MNRSGSAFLSKDGGQSRLRLALFAALIALATWLAVKLVLMLLTPSQNWEPVLVPGASPAAASAPVSYDFSYNPFAAGNAEEAEPVVVDTGDDAPETTLNLQLKGLRAGLNGTAFIQTPDGQEDNYYIGADIMPNVILRGVFPTHVLIDVNGQTQRLTTEDAKAAARNQQTQPSRQEGLRTFGRVEATQLLSQVELRPAFDNDMRRIGLAVYRRNASLDLGTFGLEEGDVITRFAGQSVAAGLPDIVALRRAAGTGRPVTIDFLRDGQPMTITIGSPT